MDGGVRDVRVAITGGTGLLGTWLSRALRDRGDEALIVTRQPPREAHEVQWDPKRGFPDASRVEALDAVVHLAGAPIAARPWTKARREILWSSRVDATGVLLDALSELSEPPKVYVGAGGLGIYGDRGDQVLTEEDGPGTGFLAELSLAWEQAHLQAADLGCRAVVLRKSIVLAPDGGAFPLMVRPFRIGFGGWLGPGRQYTAWVSIRDAVAGYLFALDCETCTGPHNLTVPDPPLNKEWCKAMGRAVNRPVLTHAPKWALRGAFGELADDLLLASVRAVPQKLTEAGFTFQDTDPEATFRWLVEAYDARSA